MQIYEVKVLFYYSVLCHVQCLRCRTNEVRAEMTVASYIIYCHFMSAYMHSCVTLCVCLYLCVCMSMYAHHDAKEISVLL